MKILLTTILAVMLVTVQAQAADVALYAQAVPVLNAPVEAVGCTAARTDSPGGYLDDYYIRGNASFVNAYPSTATEVLIDIHYAGAYGDHDVVLDKKGSFAHGVRIDPKRRAWVAMLQPEALNTDVDGSTEIDIWGTVSATCTVVGAVFSDGTTWNISTQSAAATKCVYDEKSKQYQCG